MLLKVQTGKSPQIAELMSDKKSIPDTNQLANSFSDYKDNLNSGCLVQTKI